jgi:hypothetical protein
VTASLPRRRTRTSRRAVRAAVACAALAGCALGPLASARADSSFSAAASDLAAHGGLLVRAPGWPSGRLGVGFGAAATDLRMPGAGLFSGIDLGTDAAGRTVLVYAVCRARTEPCSDLYTYSFASRRERKLRTLSLAGCDEEGPQISRGTIVFGRDCEDSHSARTRTLGGLYVKRPGKPLRRLSRAAPAYFDLAADTLAFVRRRQVEEIDGSTWRVVSEIRVKRLGQRRSRLIASAIGIESRTSSGPFLTRPRLDGGYVYWQRNVLGNRPDGDIDQPFRQDILRRRVDGSAPASQLERAGRLYARSAGDQLGTYAVSGRRLYYTVTDPQTAQPDAVALLVDPLWVAG